MIRVQARRLGLLFTSLFLIGIAVVACAAPAAPATSSSSNNGNNANNVFHTPDPNQQSPTPTFPGFTVGAWPSNYSPGNNDNITIYVICRIQDPTMQTPPKPAPGLHVIVSFTPAGNAAFNQSPLTGTTGSDGIAAVPLQLSDPTSGVPIIVQVSVTYQGVTYTAETFFTPNPQAKPTPTAGSTGTATPGNGGGNGH